MPHVPIARQRIICVLSHVIAKILILFTIQHRLLCKQVTVTDANWTTLMGLLTVPIYAREICNIDE